MLDRFLQQSILRLLQPMFAPTFSEHSHGFRPARNAHDAVCEAQRYIQEGKRVVVDIDLAFEAMKDRVREITGRTRGRSIASVVAELRIYHYCVTADAVTT